MLVPWRLRDKSVVLTGSIIPNVLQIYTPFKHQWSVVHYELQWGIINSFSSAFWLTYTHNIWLTTAPWNLQYQAEIVNADLERRPSLLEGSKHAVEWTLGWKVKHHLHSQDAIGYGLFRVGNHGGTESSVLLNQE